MDASEIETLVALAADKSPLARAALSERMAELCLAPKRSLTPEEKEIAGHILIKLTREIECDVRAHLAERLAASPDAPKELIRALAMDEISVAAPVIAQSPLLDEQDLIAIISGKTREHRMRVAMRSGITAAVTNVLVQSNEPDVLQAMVENLSAEITEAVMQYLVAESKSLENLRAPLVCRADLPQGLAQKMLAFVSGALQQQILTRFTIDQAAIEAALSDVGTAPVINKAVEGLDSKTRALIRKMQEGGKLSVLQVISFLREKRISLFLEGVAALSDLEAGTVANLTDAGEGQGLAVLARAIGADRSQFATMALLLERGRTGKPVPSARLQAICRLFDSITAHDAVATVADWRAKVVARTAA